MDSAAFIDVFNEYNALKRQKRALLAALNLIETGKDGDGFISVDEWNGFMKEHSSGMRPNRGMGGGPMGAPGDPMMPNPGNPELPLVTPPNGN